MSDQPAADIKAEAHRLIDSLPANASWDDLMEQVYLRCCIEAGLTEVRSGRVADVEEVRRRFGLLA